MNQNVIICCAMTAHIKTLSDQLPEGTHRARFSPGTDPGLKPADMKDTP